LLSKSKDIQRRAPQKGALFALGVKGVRGVKGVKELRQ
jgi:hypothetical protein